MPTKEINKMSANRGNRGWETVVDFTKIRKGGVDIDEILRRLIVK